MGREDPSVQDKYQNIVKEGNGYETFFVVCFCSGFGLDSAQDTIVVYSILRS